MQFHYLKNDTLKKIQFNCMSSNFLISGSLFSKSHLYIHFHIKYLINSYFLYEGGRNEVRKRVGGVQSTFLGTSGFSLKPERSEGFKEATSDQKRHFAHLRPFFRTEFGHPEYRILFFQTTQAFPNPPPMECLMGQCHAHFQHGPAHIELPRPQSLFLQF